MIFGAICVGGISGDAGNDYCAQESYYHKHAKHVHSAEGLENCGGDNA